MNIFFLGLCIGLLPALIIALVTTRNSSSQIATMRERLAAEEASKRHFMQLGSLLNASLASRIRNFFNFHDPLFNYA